MAYFNPVTKLDERVTTTIIKDGASVQVQANVYRCMGIREDGQGACRLCWTTFDMAKFCAMRGHKAEWVQMYGDTGFKRVALRRDAAPQGRAQAPAPSGPSAPPSPPQAIQAPEPDLEAIRAMALAKGFRLSRIPVKAHVPEPVTEYQDDFEPAF